MKRLKGQSRKIDFRSAVKAWEKNEINRDELVENLKELGFEDPEVVIEDLERERLSSKLKRAWNRGDLEEAQEASMKIIDKYGVRRRWVRPKE